MKLFKSTLVLILVTAIFLFLTSCGSTGSTQATPPTGEQNNSAYMGKGGTAEPVIVKGLAQIQKAGEQDAYDRALQHAFRQAIEKVLGVMISSSTLVENSILIEQKIYSKSAGFVSKYEILSSSKSGNTKVVEAKVWVVVGDVKNDAKALGLLQERMNRPRVLVILDEKNMDGKYQEQSKTVLHTKLTEKEFTFVDKDQLTKVLKAKNIVIEQATGIDTSTLSEIAVDSGAQILIKGKIITSEQNISSLPENWKSVRANINVDVVNAADATILASSSQQAAAALTDINTAQLNAIKKATEALSEELLDKIITKWDDMLQNGIEYDVTVTGISFSQARTLKGEFDENIEGIKDVSDKDWNNNVAQYIIKYTGMAGDLAGLLIEPGKANVKLDVIKFDSKSIILKVIE